LLKQVAGDAAEGRDFEVQKRRTIVGTVSKEAGVGRRAKGRRHTTACPTGMEESHSDGIQQCALKTAQDGAN
jgi:hypothetical protein